MWRLMGPRRHNVRERICLAHTGLILACEIVMSFTLFIYLFLLARGHLLLEALLGRVAL